MLLWNERILTLTGTIWTIWNKKPLNLALPSVSTVKPFCNKRITLTHTENNLIQAKQMKNKHSGLFTRLLVFENMQYYSK